MHALMFSFFSKCSLLHKPIHGGEPSYKTEELDDSYSDTCSDVEDDIPCSNKKEASSY